MIDLTNKMKDKPTYNLLNNLKVKKMWSFHNYGDLMYEKKIVLMDYTYFIGLVTSFQVEIHKKAFYDVILKKTKFCQNWKQQRNEKER